MSELRLTWPELQVAAFTGCQRRLRSMAQAAQTRYGFNASPTGAWGVDIEAAAAEMVLAKHLGRYWGCPQTPGYSGDVGTEEVRHTVRADGCLIIHPHDADGRRYWLVTGAIPRMRVVGWIQGRDAKQDRYWRDPGTGRPAYFVPQDALTVGRP